MKFNKNKAIGTAMVAVIVIVVAVVAAGGAYAISSGSAKTVTSTVTSTSVSTSASIATSTSISVATSTATVNPTASVKLTGAGSTFIQPVLQAMITAYQDATPTVAINYQSVGSGAGISALEGHTVDFAASDAPLQAADIAKAS
ncbi:MAG: substrate-binding domain-containing protein, partial [Thaumarchaeota archaeon]|nr:substrate-binding domain-containing protein [Nitrososphaerota archaeon]